MRKNKLKQQLFWNLIYIFGLISTMYLSYRSVLDGSLSIWHIIFAIILLPSFLSIGIYGSECYKYIFDTMRILWGISENPRCACYHEISNVICEAIICSGIYCCMLSFYYIIIKFQYPYFVGKGFTFLLTSLLITLFLSEFVVRYCKHVYDKVNHCSEKRVFHTIHISIYIFLVMSIIFPVIAMSCLVLDADIDKTKYSDSDKSMINNGIINKSSFAIRLHFLLASMYPDNPGNSEDENLLTEELIRYNINIQELINIIMSFKFEKELLANKYQYRSGIIRTILDVTHDKYWSDRVGTLDPYYEAEVQDYRNKLKVGNKKRDL